MNGRLIVPIVNGSNYHASEITVSLVTLYPSVSNELQNKKVRSIKNPSKMNLNGEMNLILLIIIVPLTSV